MFGVVTPIQRVNPYLPTTTLNQSIEQQSQQNQLIVDEEDEEDIIISTNINKQQQQKLIQSQQSSSTSTSNSNSPLTINSLTTSVLPLSSSTNVKTTSPPLTQKIPTPPTIRNTPTPFPSQSLSNAPTSASLTFRNYRQYPIKESAERSTVHSIQGAISHNRHFGTNSNVTFSVEIPFKESNFVKNSYQYTNSKIIEVKHHQTTTSSSLKSKQNHQVTSDLSSIPSSSSSNSGSPFSSARTPELQSLAPHLSDEEDSEEIEDQDSVYSEDGNGEEEEDRKINKANRINQQQQSNSNNNQNGNKNSKNGNDSNISKGRSKGKGKEVIIPSTKVGKKRTTREDDEEDLEDEVFASRKAKKVAKVKMGGGKGIDEKGDIIPGPPVRSTKSNKGLVVIPQPAIKPDRFILQNGRCLNRSYSLHQSCAACISRYSGYTCSFINLRSFPYTHLAIIPLGATYFNSNPDIASLKGTIKPEEVPNFPIEFNELFREETHASRIKTCVAKTFIKYNTLNYEVDHFEKNSLVGKTPVRVKKEIAVRSTCDGCATSIFSGSWLCSNCGKEICLDCGETLRGIGKIDEESATDSSGLNPEIIRKLTTCSKPRDSPMVRHSLNDFVPFTRISLSELKRLRKAMIKWNTEHEEPKTSIQDEKLKKYFEDPGMTKEFQNEDGKIKGFYSTPINESHPYARVPFMDITPRVMVDDFEYNPTLHPELTPKELLDIRVKYIEEALNQTKLNDVLTSETFRALWKRGEPLVVDVMGSFKLDWTPSMFQKEFGSQKCKIVSNLYTTAEDRDATVGEFFQNFGKPRHWEDSEKIKDWPSTSDFKSEFPKLFDDFMSAIPVPSVTRRDGVLNIAAHTPTNANPPDLGPKGYFSEVSYDTKGGSGSTKLHMDVADATNLMFWSGVDVGGKPGAAAWDLFRAEDTELLRDFLYVYMAEQRGEGGKSPKILRSLYDDPIHGQSVYLDKDLRARLLAEKGVKPFRIWQRPGQVVFIPAGCAHQVCNYADCIKIASDFVSIENVDRCWKVTEEFRAQVKDRKKLWREDVLQLKTQLLWAWKSCERFD